MLVCIADSISEAGVDICWGILAGLSYAFAFPGRFFVSSFLAIVDVMNMCILHLSRQYSNHFGCLLSLLGISILIIE